MYERHLASKIKSASEVFPVILLTGPRQVGKTTLLQMCDNKRNYVTLDDFAIRDLAKNDPALFLDTYQAPIIIDEIQYAPELLTYIKIKVDKELKNGQYWLTGSQKFHLMKNISESLAGRVAIFDLLGLSRAELRKSTGFNPVPHEGDGHKLTGALFAHESDDAEIQKIYQEIWLGSFPKIITHPGQRDLFYKSYIETYINRDVRDILNVIDQNVFYKFISSVAARTGQMLNYADLARDVGVDNKTIKSWLSVLEASGLVYLLYPYSNNVTKRIVKTPKLYFMDTGLCAYLTRWPNPESLESGSMSGAMFETFVFAEIFKGALYTNDFPYHSLYYYRDQDQKEVDLLIGNGDKVVAIEIKKTANPSKSIVKSIDIGSKIKRKMSHGYVICCVKNYLPLSSNVSAIPAWCL